MDIRYNSFVMYHSWVAAIRKMPIDDTAKLEALLAICEYGFTGEYVDNFAVDMVKDQMDKNITRKENGKRGGRPDNQTETKPKPNRNQTETKPKPNVNVNVNVNDNVNDNVNVNVKEREVRKIAAKPPRPTIDEVAEYVKEKNYTFDPVAFVNYYESNGWRVGKNPMKSWMAACATWQQKETEYKNNNKNNNHGRYKNNDGFSGTSYNGDTI